jgi:uncharacterized membrane protein
MNKLLLFSFLLLLFDIPFIKYVLAPKYKQIGLALEPKIIYIICGYLIMSLSWFLIKGDMKSAALTGFIIYGTYAFTLASILPGYSLSFALTEIVWGTSLFTFITYLLNKMV